MPETASTNKKKEGAAFLSQWLACYRMFVLPDDITDWPWPQPIIYEYIYIDDV
jgi:hypothetical protein